MHECVWVSGFKAEELQLLTSEHTQGCHLMKLSMRVFCVLEKEGEKKSLSGFSILSVLWHLVVAGGTATILPVNLVQ